MIAVQGKKGRDLVDTLFVLFFRYELVFQQLFLFYLFPISDSIRAGEDVWDPGEDFAFSYASSSTLHPC